jgi:catechol 2,3-dioxygenase-like lactoylglutathione lyase family enzyme
MGRVMRLEQTGIRVRDWTRSLRFYTRALGLQVAKRGDTRAWGGGRWALLEDPRSHRVIELNWYPKGSLFFSPYKAGDALDHVDFTVGVASRAVLERAYRRLLRHGARPTRWRPATTGGWMASVKDPDGVWITIGRRPTAAERRANR